MDVLLYIKFSMLTKIIFIRHCAVTYFEDPIKDLAVPLNQTGFLQALFLTNKFINNIQNLDAIYASTLLRTQQTVAGLVDYYRQDLVILTGLDEHYYNGNAMNFHKQILENAIFKYPGGESVDDSKKRFLDTLTKILQANHGKNIIIATHGTIFSNYLIETFILDSDYFFKLTYPDVYEIDYDEMLKPIKFRRRKDLLPKNFIDKL